MDIEGSARAVSANHVLAFLLTRGAVEIPMLLETLHCALFGQCTLDAEKQLNPAQSRARFAKALAAELDAVFLTLGTEES